MRTNIPCRWLAFVFLLLVCSANAQFFAPKTEFHDRVQRLYPVELVRLLSWRENAINGSTISQIKYETAVNGSRETSWTITCLDAKSNVVKTLKVHYPESLLEQGPEFYRSIFKQIATAEKWPAPKALSSEDLNSAFWKGAELNGMNREIGLRAAWKLSSDASSTSADYPPQMAGLLSHIPLPSLSGAVTLDVNLLARAAAWLALSESAVNKATPNDELWAPIIFMAGRENAACALWVSKIKQVDNADAPLMHRWWDFFLRRPKSRAVFEFAAESEQQRKFSMPMLVYYSRIYGLGASLAEVLIPLYGETPQQLGPLCNYGSYLSHAIGIGGGRILEGAWAAIFREHWVDTLLNQPLSPLDYSAHRDKAKAISEELKQLKPVEQDLSLVGLHQCAPLIQLGYQQGGEGSLIPVGIVTARDLLNYGWEMNGLMMGSRYNFVSHNWGIPELATTIFNEGTRSLEGQAPFYYHKFQNDVFNLQESQYRLQMVDDIWWRDYAFPAPFTVENTNAITAAQLFYKRCWLAPNAARPEGWALGCNKLDDEMATVWQRYHKDCGQKSDAIILESILDWYKTEKDLDAAPKIKQLKTQLAESIAEPSHLKITALYAEQFRKLNNGERAQAYEKLFWQNPNSGLEQSILNGYIVAGAWKSAERFYRQSREAVAADVSFSNFLSPEIWMLGFLKNDEDTMKLAFEDSNTGSAMAMLTRMWHFAAHSDYTQLEHEVDDYIQRYQPRGGDDSQGQMIKNFIPLIPALADPKNPKHGEALDFFGKSRNATNLRWVFIQKYKLPVDEAIRFLGGEETDRLRRVMIVGLKQDKPNIRTALTKYISSDENKSAGRVISSWLEVHLLDISTGIDETDLKPADAKSITQAVMDKLAKTAKHNKI